MNKCDLSRLNRLNERCGSTNLTSFRIVDTTTSKETVLRHIELDLQILNSSEVEFKHVFMVIAAKCHIDICSVDNGIPLTYVFTNDTKFTPKSISPELTELCRNFDVHFEERN